MTGGAPSKTEITKTSSIGKAVGKIIDQENWSIGKIAVMVTVLILPFGPFALALYFATKEVIRRRKKEDA